ncbi:MAG: hypothetical protein PHF57_08350 [Methanoregula sp.]|nr:hypothetical protein [Methanoregula sp.]
MEPVRFKKYLPVEGSSSTSGSVFPTIQTGLMTHPGGVALIVKAPVKASFGVLNPIEMLTASPTVTTGLEIICVAEILFTNPLRYESPYDSSAATGIADRPTINRNTINNR